MIDFNPPKIPKCKHCKKDKGNHKGKTFHCPIGTKTKIGYTMYHPEQVYEPK